MWVVIALLSLCVCPSSLLASSSIGTIALVGGETWVLKEDKTKVDAKRGMVLVAGDTVVTGHRGRAKLLMMDGSTLLVSRDSRLEVKRYALSHNNEIDEAKLDLFWGRVRFQVKHLNNAKGSFHMRTTTAVMGVRGTSGVFSSVMLPTDNAVRLKPRSLSSVPKRPSGLVLTSGLVSMRSLVSGKRLLVRAGQTAIAGVRGALSVRPSRQRDVYLPPRAMEHGGDKGDSVASSPSTSMPAPLVESNPQDRAASQAAQTFDEQMGIAVSDQKIANTAQNVGSQAIKRAQTQAQVGVRQKVNSVTSIVIVPKVVGP